MLVGHGGPEMLVYRRDVPTPRPRSGEVLIAVRAAGVNNVDLNTRIGWYGGALTQPDDGARASGGWTGDRLPFPLIQGTDVCGVIVEVGDGVPAARLGERVVVRSCLGSLRRDGIVPWLGSELDGGFAQFVRVPSVEAYRVVTDLSDVQLAAAPCAYGTAENLLDRTAVVAGERVLITGASGGVGCAAVQLARLRGAEVIAVAGRDKAARLHELGASTVLPRDAEFATQVPAGGVDVVIDLVGGSRWPALLAVLRSHGHTRSRARSAVRTSRSTCGCSTCAI